MSRSSPWHPASWRDYPVAQLAAYPDAGALAEVERKLGQAAPVAWIADSQELKARLAEVAAGRAMLLQGGDCAETLDTPSHRKLAALVELFDAMADQLRSGFGLPVVSVARLAGQFAKPRSMNTERRGDRELPAWRGDGVNSREFAAQARVPDPARMLRAHAHAIATRDLLAALPQAPFISHEALLLPYEQALVRCDPATKLHWSVSGHMLWVGDRTRQVEGAHVEFLRGIANPVGIKCGPSLTADELVALCDRLDPEREPGRLTLIVRLGADSIADILPSWMRTLRSAERSPLWLCDPLHGNTERVAGRKVRRVERIQSEAQSFFAIAASEGAHPGGLHVEMTPEAVTECVGHLGPGSPEAMDEAFLSACDPRLNRGQALELAQQVARQGARAAAA